MKILFVFASFLIISFLGSLSQGAYTGVLEMHEEIVRVPTADNFCRVSFFMHNQNMLLSAWNTDQHWLETKEECVDMASSALGKYEGLYNVRAPFIRGDAYVKVVNFEWHSEGEVTTGRLRVENAQ